MSFEAFEHLLQSLGLVKSLDEHVVDHDLSDHVRDGKFQDIHNHDTKPNNALDIPEDATAEEVFNLYFGAPKKDNPDQSGDSHGHSHDSHDHSHDSHDHSRGHDSHGHDSHDHSSHDHGDHNHHHSESSGHHDALQQPHRTKRSISHVSTVSMKYEMVNIY